MKCFISIDSATGRSDNVRKSAYSYYIRSNNNKLNYHNSKLLVNKSKHQMILIGSINVLSNVILRRCNPKSDIISVTTNSMYLIHPIFSNWIKEWSQNNFKDIKNGSLWRRLVDITHLFKHLSFQWKKGINPNTDHLLVKAFRESNHKYFKNGRFNYGRIIHDVNEASLKVPKNPKYFKQWKLDTVPAYRFNSRRKHYKRISTGRGMKWRRV